MERRAPRRVVVVLRLALVSRVELLGKHAGRHVPIVVGLRFIERADDGTESIGRRRRVGEDVGRIAGRDDGLMRRAGPIEAGEHVVAVRPERRGQVDHDVGAARLPVHALPVDAAVVHLRRLGEQATDHMPAVRDADEIGALQGARLIGLERRLRQLGRLDRAPEPLGDRVFRLGQVEVHVGKRSGCRRRRQPAGERVDERPGEEEIERSLVGRGVGVALLHDEVAEDVVAHEFAAQPARHPHDQLAVPRLGQPQHPARIRIIRHAAGDLQARHRARERRAVRRVRGDRLRVRARRERRRRQPGTGVVLRSRVGIRRRQVGAHRAIDILSLGQQRELHFAARVLSESRGSERT